MTATTVAPATVTGPIPQTSASPAVVLEPYAVDLMGLYGYTQTEYLVSGEAAGEPYTTRLLVRHPRDMARASGRALAEVSHIWGGTSVWRAAHREIMRTGSLWVEIDAQAPSAIDLVKHADPERYAAIRFSPGELASDFKASIPFTEDPTPADLAREYDEFKARWWAATPQAPGILAQAAHALRHDLPGLAGSAVRTLVLAGISQTGGVVRRFVERHHEGARGPGGVPAFDGYLPAASGGDALPDVDVPVIELLGEAEFQSVRWPCGVSGQVRGLSHRRGDSDTFRLFEVAGMAHRETRRMSAADVARLRDCPLPSGARWSTFPNSHVYNAVLAMLWGWIEDGVAPPASRHLDTVGDSDEIERDDVGNARGGVRTTYTDVPLSSLCAATPVGRPSWYHGSEVPLASEALAERYGDPAGYRERVGEQLAAMLDDRFIRPADAEELRLAAESVRF